jgi:hypothetical protein
MEGGVSQLDIENSLRFDNKLMAFDTTAQGLKAILEHGVAAGTLQGRFPQIGGVAFSWDPDLPAGSRVSDIALLDGDGESVVALYDDGVLQAGVPARITVVTLNFLANGGDGYPTKANGENFRYLLADGSLSAPVDEALDFTAPATIAANTTPAPRCWASSRRSASTCAPSTRRPPPPSTWPTRRWSWTSGSRTSTSVPTQCCPTWTSPPRSW